MAKTLVLAAFAGLAGFAQSPTETGTQPAFEVAAIRHAPHLAEYGTVTITADDHRPGQIHYANMSLKGLLTRAYGVEDFQIEGPDWLDSEVYDITAKAPADTPRSQRMAMLQNLLVERLRMKVHREKKDMMAYVLQRGKSAPALQEAKREIKVRADGTMEPGSMAGPGRLVINKQSMEGLASILGALLRSPVVDMTGIKGEFNLTLEWKIEDGEGGKVTPGSSLDRVLPDSVFAALREKTGLILRRQKAPVDMLIIDHAEKMPTEN